MLVLQNSLVTNKEFKINDYYSTLKVSYNSCQYYREKMPPKKSKPTDCDLCCKRIVEGN